MGGASIRRPLMLCAVVLALAFCTAPGYAQSGSVKGKVVDGKNAPVEGAVVTIESADGMNRKFAVKTNKRGEYIQIGIQGGEYKITAVKEALSQTFTRRLSGVNQTEVNFSLMPGGGGDISEEDRKKAEAKIAAVKTAFEAGVTLSNEGKFDEAIVKFNEVIAAAPKCVECYTNIGAVQARKKDYDAAEASFKKALEINPNSSDAYNGLATVYNQQKKFDQAAEASAQAQKLAGTAGPAGAPAGPNASTVFNQGVISWNAGKIPEAKKSFEDAVRIDPKLAEAHYWLGMANLNEGKLPEAVKGFEEYLRLAPTGQYAEQAKGILSQIKK